MIEVASGVASLMEGAADSVLSAATMLPVIGRAWRIMPDTS